MQVRANGPAAVIILTIERYVDTLKRPVLLPKAKL